MFNYCEHWPFTQKFALVVESIFLYMKMHSYMLSNQELYDLKYGSNAHKKHDDEDSQDTIPSVEDVDQMNDEQVRSELAARGLRDFSAININKTTPANFCYYVIDHTQVNIYGFSSCYKNRTHTAYHSVDTDAVKTETNGYSPSPGSVSESEDDADDNLKNGKIPRLGTRRISVEGLEQEIKDLQKKQESEQVKAYMRMVLKD